jgi:signal transduction histidine kinase
MAVISPAELVSASGELGAASVERPKNSSHDEQALRDLGRRSVPGTAGHFAAMVFAQVRLASADGLPHGMIAMLTVGFLVIRIAAHHMTSRQRGSLRQRWVLLAVGSIGMNVVWGVMIAGVQIHTGAGEESLAMAFILCGVAAGGVSALAPNQWIQRASLSALMLPVVVLGFAGLGLISFAVLQAVFFAYLLAQGNAAYRDYWTSVRATEQLLRNAESAQLAATTADTTNHQLRTEIAHRSKVEIELRQAQKLEAIGRLAAGIAHEINTPIQFISDSCRFIGEGIHEVGAGLDDYRRIMTDLVESRIAPADALADTTRVYQERDLAYLRENLPAAATLALDGLQRVARIVSATKEFAYPHRKEKSLADVNKAIESTLIISNNETKYVADVETEFGELPMVMCHCGELNQVVLNLIVNAAHAIGDVVEETGARGVIRIKTWADADWIHISISDTGSGIPAEILDKIYEPFFTTKPVGKGSGQGLATARSAIVDKHRGTLDVRSQVGVGTTFTIGLPRT